MEKLGNNVRLETPARSSFGDSRYLTKLWVSVNGEPQDEEQQVTPSVDSSFSTISRLGMTAENVVPHNQKIVGMINSALKRLCFREQRVLVQFWSPHAIGKHRLLLTTKDQPFGLGVNDDQGLILYRKYSERNSFLVDYDRQEEDNSPPARVFRRGLPEWSSDIPTNYSLKHFPLQDCAISCNLHGYLAIPVFDSTTMLCVGVLEVLGSSKYTSFSYEFEEIHRELKKEKLTCSKTSTFPFSVASEASRNDRKNILKALKTVCNTYSLPLAQTWTASPSASLVPHGQIIGKSCNSFDTGCVGKFCLSTAGLPFHVQDMCKWSFREASREKHLETPRGVVGRVFSTQGSCYCTDVTKLSVEEFPLVHNACISKLTGCFAIFLQSENRNHKYVLEFFLPGPIKDLRYLSSVVQTLKENMVASGFELSDKPIIHVIGPPTDLYVHKQPDIIETSSNEMGDNCSSCMDSSCSDQSVTIIAGTDCANVVSPTHISMENTCAGFTDDVEKSNVLKEDRKRKRDSGIGPLGTRKVTVKATFGETEEEFDFYVPSELLNKKDEVTSNLKDEVTSNLKDEVAKRFELMGNMIKLKYYDEINDLILICCDEDVKSALCASKSKNTISLIVKNCEDEGMMTNEWAIG